MAMLRNPPADAPERQGRWVFLCLVTAKAISKRACVRPRAGDEDLVAGSAGAIFIEGGRDAMAPEKMVRPGIARTKTGSELFIGYFLRFGLPGAAARTDG